jgi:hypothetical protein
MATLPTIHALEQRVGQLEFDLAEAKILLHMARLVHLSRMAGDPAWETWDREVRELAKL